MDAVGSDPNAKLLEFSSHIARVGGWSLDVHNRHVVWTDEVFRLHDLEPGPVPDLATCIGYYDEASRPTLAAAIEACSQSGQPFDLELPVVTARGRRLWLSIKGEAEREGGRIVRVRGAVQDVTLQKLAQQQLRDSEDRYRGIFDNAADAFLVISLDGYIRDANPKACRTYGYSIDELIGLHGSQFVHPDHAGKFGAALESIHAGQPYTVESVDLRKGGVPFPIEVHISPFVYRGEPVMLCSVRDITERRQNETRMREALAVFNASSQAIMTTDADGTIIEVNPAFESITGYAASEAVGRKPSMLSSGRHDSTHFEAMWQELTTTGRWEGEVWNRRKNGQIYAQWQTVNAVRDNQGRIIEYVALFSDITQRKEQEAAVWRQANFDTLTGLANRSLFQDRLERAMAQARRNQTRLGVLFLDLDAFKGINDTLGHDVGDQLLVEVARRLKGCVRERDTVARLGGDEFTVVVHDVADTDDLRTVGEKAIGVLREPFTLAGAQHFVTGSAGITVFPDDGDTVQALLRNADIAMYKSKQAGRNRCHFYSPLMQTEALHKLRVESELREAVLRHEFVLHYQPVVDADSGEMVAAEALLRWQHPQRGLLLPADFLSVAEDSRLIVPIGEWAMREAARQRAAWQVPGQSAPALSINLSPIQLSDAALPQRVSGLLAEFGFARDALVLEFTESVLGDHGLGIEERLEEIGALGVGCTLDRFGTGLTSLASLKRLAVDVVKIDRSLLQGCPSDRGNVHMVEAVVQMAHSLGLRVAACGVETEAQRDMLRDLGCDMLQGHLIGAPVPAAEFGALVRQRRFRAPGGGSTPEQARLLAALRQDALDVDQWVRRLVAEQSPELLSLLEGRGWTSRGLDLRKAVNAHLQCRQCLADLVCERPSLRPAGLRCAGPGHACTVGQWLAEARAQGDTRFDRLEAAFATYQRLAEQISADFRHGYRDSARRALASLRFRTASRDVVLALIDSFKDAGNTQQGSL